jgi:hypothetical protein
MTSIPIIDESEGFLRLKAKELTQPRDNECLCFYVARQVDEFSCDGSLRHALHYRDVRAPRFTGLAGRLGRMGGYCDCEILMNGYELRNAVEEGEDGEIRDVEVVPACAGARSGTVEPCENWVRIRRW